jgi:hypothetical protein
LPAYGKLFPLKGTFMIRALALLACLTPASAFAQSNVEPPAGNRTAHHMTHEQHMRMDEQAAGDSFATQSGQAAFAAIQEIVQILVADPKTDWSKVDIEALRQHLIDMNNVTLLANVKNEAIDGGMRFNVTGEGPVRESIRRMTLAHAAMMNENGLDGWKFEAAEIDGGASMTVLAPAKDIDKLRGLGFLGVLTLGTHHQAHHLMIARGVNPHE